MWPLKIFCCLIIWPSIIHGNDLKNKLIDMANENEPINNMFELVPGGFLGQGLFAVVFKGIRISDRRPVALKFVPKEKSEEMEKSKEVKKKKEPMELEFNICTYLKAINASGVEQFGIPAVYYYGHFLDGSVIIMAITSLEQDLWTKDNERHFVENPINSLILLKQFIVTTKYMHSLGVRHDDIKPENIMFRRDRSFLIDFNLSSKILEDEDGGTIEFCSRRIHKTMIRTPMCDWESFLYVLCQINRVNLKFLPHMNFDITNQKIAFRSAGKMKFETNDTITAIKLAVTDPHLRPVFIEFAEHVLLSDEFFPDYDGMYETVNEAIKKFPKDSKFYTWLTPAEIMAAKVELDNHPEPDVENALIRAPNSIDFDNYRYPEPYPDIFGGFGLMRSISSKFALVVKSLMG